MKKIIILIFSFIWQKRLSGNSWNGKPMKVIKVKGWRTAIVESCGNRMTISFCFWFFN